MSRIDAIEEVAATTAGLAGDAVGWLDDTANAEKIGNEKRALVREVRRLQVTANKLRRAVRQQMCVGVFGPSQAGKSYLVSALARPKGRSPIALFGEREIDFLKKINPEGGKESTGLVTRFSVLSQKHPSGFPVCLKLLTETDIVKILCNTFFLDGDQKVEPDPDPAKIKAALDEARRHMADKPQPGISEIDVWDLQEYVETQFEGTPYLGSLQGFWSEAAELLPRLGVAERGALLSHLWGGHQPFTSLYATLANALGRLGHAEAAYCGLEALVPRSESIIDVATLAGLGRPDQELPDQELPVRPESGPAITLTRSVIAALTAEIRMPLKEEPWPFFKDTDLLDFPGARSRQRVPLAQFFEMNQEALKECFLRGKVAYLFDRYVAEHELTSMLLCIPDSNQDVATLPDMIDSWIERTHGKTPEERQKRPCILFFVMTKFDMHFTEKGGADEDNLGTRFASRMFASLAGFFGRAHDWPQQWTPSQPFSNCYWLRNPSYPAEAIIRYDGDKREVEHRPDKIEYLSRLRAAYLTVEAVQRHFRDPARAWDEALKLNDGGISYLAESLAPVCNSGIKLEQIAGRLNALRWRIIAALERYHVADDVETRLDQRRAAAARVIEALYRAADMERFGHLLRCLQVRSDELADLLYQVGARPAGPNGETVRVATTSLRSPETRARPRPRPSPAPFAAEALEHEGPITLSFEEVLANAAFSHWTQRLHQLARSGRLCRALGIEEAAMGELTGELIAAAHRLELSRGLAEEIRRHSWIEKGEKQTQKAAALAALTINRFVDYLGFDAKPVAARPVVEADETVRPVFLPPAITHDASAMADEPDGFGGRFVEDWVFAFYRLVEENAISEKGQLIDVEQNARIGRVLAGLRPEVVAGEHA